MTAYTVLPTQPEKTKENYQKFLESDFWIALSRKKRKEVGKCERCGGRFDLQSHHKVYPENWWNTTEAMLEVLCRPCHKKEHGIEEKSSVIEVDDSQIPEHAFLGPPTLKGSRFSSWKMVNRARSQKLITRAEFQQLKEQFKQSGRLKAPRKKTRHRRSKKLKEKWRKSRWQSARGRMTGYINRGRSSN